jgi:hypothetical protein
LDESDLELESAAWSIEKAGVARTLEDYYVQTRAHLGAHKGASSVLSALRLASEAEQD